MKKYWIYYVKREEIFYSEPAVAECLEATEILDANYEKANLANIVKEQCNHLTKEEKMPYLGYFCLMKTCLMVH